MDEFQIGFAAIVGLLSFIAILLYSRRPVVLGSGFGRKDQSSAALPYALAQSAARSYRIVNDRGYEGRFAARSQRVGGSLSGRW